MLDRTCKKLNTFSGRARYSERTTFFLLLESRHANCSNFLGAKGLRYAPPTPDIPFFQHLIKLRHLAGVFLFVET